MLRNPSPLKQYDDEDLFLDPNTSVAFQTKQDDPSTPDAWEGDKDTPEYEAWKRRKKQFKEQNKDVEPKKKAANKEASIGEDITNAGVTDQMDKDGDTWTVDHDTGLWMKNGNVVDEAANPLAIVRAKASGAVVTATVYINVYSIPGIPTCILSP